MMVKSNYYISSFFWSTAAKILNAVWGFISVPLLLGYYGKAEYGLLSIATACNGYMHLLDLGMNTGAVKFYSQWKVESKIDKIFNVARTNITFYLLIAVVNIILLLFVAFYGENLFSVTHEQFLQLRMCLFVIAIFSVFSWITTVFNQLLIADKQMAFTMQVQCVQAVLKTFAVALVFIADLTLTTYFFYLTAFVALAIVPYAYKCKKDGLIDSFKPSWCWGDFKVVMMFSLSIFALSLFQMTATQSRPILLSMFAVNGATAVADFKIIEVVPQLIIMIGGTFSGIFLPKTSEMVARKDEKAMHDFAYKWTTYTTVVVAMMCFPFILCAREVLSAYVGSDYSYLSKWLIVWCVTVLIQMHTTPGNALVLAQGKTRLLVKITAMACIISMLLNVFLCRYIDVGSAVIAYFVYVLIIIGLYYVSFYKKLLQLDRLRLFKCFAVPTLIAVAVFFCVSFITVSVDMFGGLNMRLAYILICVIKSLVWVIPYMIILSLLKIVDFKQFVKSKNGNMSSR